PALVHHGWPGGISRSGPPRSCVRPRPSSIISSWPLVCVCQFDRLPAGNLSRVVRMAFASTGVGVPPTKLLCCAAAATIHSSTPAPTIDVMAAARESGWRVRRLMATLPSRDAVYSHRSHPVHVVPRGWMIPRTLASVALTLAVVGVLASMPHAQDVRRGAALFAETCAACHGADANGDNGPNLTTVWAS